MVPSSTPTRERIVQAADELFYRQGFEPTSFSSIAKIVGISRGNFYHHFKTKDQILDAVIDHRLANTDAMLRTWEANETSPEGRIRCFIRILITNRAKIELYGCPVGSLCTELAKLKHGAQAHAGKIMDLFRSWLRRQFEDLGFDEDVDALALHVLGLSQGIAVLATTLRDPAFVDQEVQRMEA